MLEKGRSSTKLGTSHDLPSINQYLAAGRVGETRPRVQRRHARGGSKRAVHSDAPEPLPDELMNLEIRRSRGGKASGGSGDRVGQLHGVPDGAAPGRTSNRIQSELLDAVDIVASYRWLMPAK